MDTSAHDYVTEDDDGEIPTATNFKWVVDISHLLSRQLGKQMPMTATYRVKGIHLSLRNVNNTNDNDYALAIGGTASWYSPTKHRVDAIQYAREYLRTMNSALRNDDDSPFAPWANVKTYKGLRFNFRADGEVDSANDDQTTVLGGTQWSLYEILNHYNDALGGMPADEGYTTDSDGGSAIWASRTGFNNMSSLYWNTSYKNSMLQDIGSAWSAADGATDTGIDFIFDPQSKPYDFMCPSENHLPVLGGLMEIHAFHSNTDNPRFGEVEDEYYIQCSVIVEGWEEF